MSIESAIITLSGFAGLSPKTSDAMASNGVASVCRDFFVRGGGLMPMKAPKMLSSALINNAAAGGFIYSPNHADKKWVFTTKPVHQMLWREQRIIVSDSSGIPRQINAAANVALPQDGENNIPQLRFVPPAATANNALSLTANQAGGQAGATDADIGYAATFINEYDDESTPITATIAAERIASTVTLSIANIDNTNLNGATHVRFYRQSTAGSSYFILPGGDIPIANPTRQVTQAQKTQTTYLRLFNSEAGIPLASEQAVPLPGEDGGLKKIVAMPGGFLAAHSNTWIWFSAVGRPTVFPREYRIRIGGGAKIQTIEQSVDSLYVFTEGGSPVIITAQQPPRTNNPAFISFSEIPWHCVSGGSVVNTGYGVFYASKSGIVALRGTSGELLTQGMFDADSFAKYITNEPRAASADGIYYLFSNHATLMLDTQAIGGLQCVELSAKMEDAKENDGTLYFVNDGCLCELFGGSNNLTGEWISRVLRYANPQIPAAVQVFADYNPTTITEHFGGIGSAGIGAHRIGRGGGDESEDGMKDVTVDSIQENAKVDIALETGDGEIVWDDPDVMVFYDKGAKKSRKGGRRRFEELCVGIRSNRQVRTVAIAPTGMALRGAA